VMTGVPRTPKRAFTASELCLETSCWTISTPISRVLACASSRYRCRKYGIRRRISRISPRRRSLRSGSKWRSRKLDSGRAEQAESDSHRRLEIAKSKADEQIITEREKLEIYRRESIAQIERTRLEADSSIEADKFRAEKVVQERLVELQRLKNQTGVTLEAQAKARAAQILADGEEESIRIIEETRNGILSRKVAMLAKSGSAGNAVLFMQQQLPKLFDSYKTYAEGMAVDSLVVMDEETGFNGAVNRGPAAFVDFLKQFDSAFGINIQRLLGADVEGGRS